MNKKILGLDLGTNSIGWALIEQDFENKTGKILGMGSRIIPMTEDKKNDFGKGNSISQTADRTNFRSIRRLRERHLLRRERLHRVLNVLGFLPAHYASQIDFEKRLGQFLEETEPKLAYNKKDFIFKKPFEEMLEDFRRNQPELINRKNKKGEDAKIPYDWTIYYLRKKALTQKLEKEELAWLILNFNQKRGYYQLRGEEEEENPNKLIVFYSLKVVDVKAEVKYTLVLENGESFYRSSEVPLLDWKDTNREFIVTTYLNDDGTIKKDKDGKERKSYFLKEDIAILKRSSAKSTKQIRKKSNEIVEEQSFKIVEMREEKQDETWYSLILENGWVYRRSSKIALFDWKDQTRDFIVTTDLNDDGTIKTDEEGTEKRSFRSPGEDDWTLLKKKTEQDIDKSHKTVGTYIYDTLLKNPNQKIKGKLVRTIERKFYKEELKAILNKQIELQPELFTKDLFNDCIRELYRNNEAQQISLSNRDFVHLFIDDIIFYQRPLRSQKSSIGNCSLEYRIYKVIKKDEKGNFIKDANDKFVYELDETGKPKEVKEYLKGIPKSHPLYQEFRLWQWLYNLKIYTKEEDKDVTADFINTVEDWENLFDFLNSRKEVNHKDILTYLLTSQIKAKYPDAKAAVLNKEISKEISKYRWNYVFDDSKEKEEEKSKKYPCNKTRWSILNCLEKNHKIDLSQENELKIWHLLYSVSTKAEIDEVFKEKANRAKKKNKDGRFEIQKLIREIGFNETEIEKLKNVKIEEKDYGNFSEKAIRKLLPLMRLGKYWNWEDLNAQTEERISKILTGEYDENIKNRVREKAIHLTTENDFQGLQLWLAQYIVYDRHSEAENAEKWNSVNDLEKYLEEFKQHSLRNPIVEQVITETLRVVKDIWQFYGNGTENYFNEIHVELGREMKNAAEDRKSITNQVIENENTNLRIKAILIELLNDSEVENVRPYSPMQQEAFKIYEDGVLNSGIEIPEFVTEIIKKFRESDIKKQPTSSEINRYKLWLEQKYKSPYTGQIIPLNKLFTDAYQIEHVIPQARYFDDSFSNKVICEASVNKLKDIQLGLEFIKNHYGEEVQDGEKIYKILTEKEYKEFVNEHYKNNRSKRNKLLLDEIPDKMIARQMNDTRYISKFISNLLSNIVRVDKDDDGINSKNILPGNGKITSILKQDWGLNDVWNDLVLPRFERMNELTKSTDFTAKNKEGHIIPNIPLKLSKGFQKKRIDHRHHAMDALVIACVTRDHINLLNNQSAKSETTRYDLQRKLRKAERYFNQAENKEKDKFTDFIKPWETFTQDVKNELEKIVVSFKQNLRVINKTTNKYGKYIQKNGTLVKTLVAQTKGDSWAIRKSLHTPMPYGKRVYEFDILKIADNVGKREFIIDDEIKLKVEEAYQSCNCKITDTQKYLKKNPIKDKNGNETIVTAFKIKAEKFRKRQPLSELSNRGQGGIKTVEDAIQFIDKIADHKIRQDLLNHLKESNNELEKAFSAEGLERFNIKRKIPVYKLPIAESGSGRFAVGNKIGTRHKWVEADKNTNLFFAVYVNDNGNRNFKTIPLNEVIEHQKWRNTLSKEEQKKTPIVPIKIDRSQFLFYLSPNDLVYVPTEDELENVNGIDFRNLSKTQRNRTYKMVSSSGSQCFFIRQDIATTIVNKLEFSTLNKTERAIDGEMIKDICIKLKVDRLGNISKA